MKTWHWEGLCKKPIEVVKREYLRTYPKKRDCMAQKSISIQQLIASRPPDAIRRILSIFKSHHCRACGKCCKEKNGIMILATEQNAKQLYSEVDRKVPQRKIERDTEGLFINPKENGECHFLADRATCSIYSHRPLICRMFPFIGKDSMDQNGTLSSNGIIALTSHCNIIRRLKEREIGILYISDILLEMKTFDPSFIGQYPEDMHKMLLANAGNEMVCQFSQMLEKSVKALIDTIQLGIFSTRTPIASDNTGKAVFPIL
ncbi:MAG: YkgJ family cysteine cluster protein [Candidatus Micrarchaeota archaeon]